MEKTERIGKITLDYTCYPGEDFYCDGAVEDELLRIVQEAAPEDYAGIIEERGEWPVFYHLSPLRGNIVNWIPLTSSDKVLEVGSGCGAVTGALAAKAGRTDCVDLSRKRSLINAYRNRECDHVTIRVGNFKEIEPGLPCDYDYIFLIGVFEYGQSYIGGEKPYEEFLRTLYRHIRPGGRIVIAIENKFGLKYWAGCREDHLGTWFAGIEDYAAGGGVRTFTRNGLERICRTEGIEEYSFYYPYPDYKFPTALYSDRRLPRVGELSTNLCNYDRDRMLLFDEKNAFDGIIRDGEFPLFSNSYLLLIGPELPVIYSKYSNDRAAEFAVRTEILKLRPEPGRTGKRFGNTEQGGGTAGQNGGNTEQSAGNIEDLGRFLVRKTAMTPEAGTHIRRILEAGRLLKERYGGSSFLVNRCRLSEDGTGVELEYVSGPTMEELLDDCLDRGDEAGFRKLFQTYCDGVSFRSGNGVIDFDLIFSNLIRTKEPERQDAGAASEDTWTILDYEWTLPDYEQIFGHPIEIEDVILRALYCYSLGAWKRRKLSHELIKEISGREESVLEELERQEKTFQQYVTGRRMALADIRNRIGQSILPVQQLLARRQAELTKLRLQIYPDTGSGFGEENSWFLDVYEKDAARDGAVSAVLELETGPDWRAVRIDPALEACLMCVHSLSLWNGTVREELTLRDKRIMLNGDLISKNTVLFATQDPNLTIALSRQGRAGDGTGSVRRIRMELSLALLPPGLAAEASGGLPGRGIFGFGK